MARRSKLKSGPKMVYDRELTETMRLSALAKELATAGAARTGVSRGDFVEHLLRTRAREVQAAEFADAASA